MREYDVRITEDARSDLHSIYQYVVKVSFVENAELVKDRIIQKLESFRYAPERSGVVGVDQHGWNIRSTSAGRYRILYAVSQETREVFIARILGIGRDYQPEVFKIARP